jgi:hypothetical protein
MVRIEIELDDAVVGALDRMMVDFDLEFRSGVGREKAAAMAVRDWLITTGYLPEDDLEEGTPTESEA